MAAIFESPELISARREAVTTSYNAAKAANKLAHLTGDDRATTEYIYENQIFDAHQIADIFYINNRRVVSIQKNTKVGADGLMIETAKIMTTHPNDTFVINPANVRIITGMSNAGWEKDMKDKAPSCFQNNIFHHGQLSKANLTTIDNALIIIDEIDSGDKEGQVLHTTLKDAGILNVKYMEEKNIRFVFISATMIKELYDLYQWGEKHELYKMTIPDSYIGHKDFLDREIIKEFYPLDTNAAAEKWIQEDVIGYYKTPCMCDICNPEQNPEKQDFRVHIVRANTKNVGIIQNACIRNGIKFKNHTSTDRLSPKEIKELFKDPLTSHVVIAVKGFFRRANLIPNQWKLRIGSMLELYTKKVDNNVQIQGLVGRMTGYWRDVIESGHITGPYRTSIKSIEEYEMTYHDPFGKNSYQTSGFKKKKGKVSASPTMISPKNIANLQAVRIHQKGQKPIIKFEINEDEICHFDATNITKLFRKYNEDILTNYHDYVYHCWNIDSESKCEKYGLKSMLKDDAYSIETNITAVNKTKNVLMCYLYEQTIIINPWNGKEII